ncbi:MAG: hypothetical protein ACI4ME_01125 [Aristaeellaceae bacterium]
MDYAPSEMRGQALQLLRKCWKVILITSVILIALSVISICVTNLIPVIPDQNGYITRQSTQLRSLVDLLLTFVTDHICQPILMLGLYTVLLYHLRGNGTTATTCLHGMKRWNTAIWLDILIGLRMLGYLLAGLVGMFVLSLIPILGALAGSIGFVVLIYWVELRYSHAPLHLAEDGDDRLLRASDCIHDAIQDAETFTVSRLFKVLWPAFLLAIVSDVLGKWLPDSLPLTCVCIVLSYAALAIQTTCLTVVFQHLRDDNPQDAAPSEGELRARALAAGGEEQK